MMDLKVDMKQGIIKPIHEINKNVKPQIAEKPRVDRPIRYPTYYKTFNQKWETNKTVATSELKRKEINKNKLYLEIKDDTDKYIGYGIDINNYPEFELGNYGNGKLYRDLRKIFTSDDSDVDNQIALLPLMKYAELTQDIHKLENYIKQCDKFIALKYKEFLHILKTFYDCVHKALIIGGFGYAFSGELGTIFINRVYRGFDAKSKVLDYAKTKQKKAEILARGGHIYNKEEAEWCKENGIKYEYEDYRVYRTPEYFYEYPLIGCHLPKAGYLKFTLTDYRAGNIRGKSNKQLAKECNNDLNAICDLGLDVKTKLNICLEADKLLFSNFVRNENQSSMYPRTSSW